MPNISYLCLIQYVEFLIKHFVFQNMDKELFLKKLNDFDIKNIKNHKTFCKKVLNLTPGQRAVVVNGRVSSVPINNLTSFVNNFSSVNSKSLNCLKIFLYYFFIQIIGPFDANEEFTSEDFHLLEIYSKGLYADKLVTELKSGMGASNLDR